MSCGWTDPFTGTELCFLQWGSAQQASICMQLIAGLRGLGLQWDWIASKCFGADLKHRSSPKMWCEIQHETNKRKGDNIRMLRDLSFDITEPTWPDFQTRWNTDHIQKCLPNLNTKLCDCTHKFVVSVGQSLICNERGARSPAIRYQGLKHFF